MQNPKKIVIIIGTRPEAIKLIPLFLKFKERKQFEPIIISTGQHKEIHWGEQFPLALKWLYYHKY